jgi:hypothetical protein
MKADSFAEYMPVEAFVGATGDVVVLLQEWPNLKGGEEYIRLMVPISEAKDLAESILAVLREAKP